MEKLAITAVIISLAIFVITFFLAITKNLIMESEGEIIPKIIGVSIFFFILSGSILFFIHLVRLWE